MIILQPQYSHTAEEVNSQSKLMTFNSYKSNPPQHHGGIQHRPYVGQSEVSADISSKIKTSNGNLIL